MHPEIKMGTCLSCRASIFFGLTRKGKRIPVDAEPTEDGTLYFTPLNDEWGGVIVLGGSPCVEVISAANPPLPCVEPERFTPHFATCPNADFHRQRK
jgi:hypothetical protein